MLDRFERPIRIICLAMAILFAYELGNLIFRGDPLKHLKIPALPTLPGGTNETAKAAEKETNAVTARKTSTNGMNAMGTNSAKGTNAASGTNAMVKSIHAPSLTEIAGTNANSGPKQGESQKHGPHGDMPPGMPPEMMAQMMGGGMPGGPNGGMKKVELPPEVQSRVDKIIDSEIFGPVIRPMPMALIGIADEQAFIQATNGQIGPIKVGGEMAGIKLLRIGVNRVLVEQGGEKKELTLFGGLGSDSLMPDPASGSTTNTSATNSSSTNASTGKVSSRNAAATNAFASHIRSSQQKETP
jgi:hypothetical protein